MTHTYEIKGMTCGSCIVKVKKVLLATSGITSADIQLQYPQATVTMQKHITTAGLQNIIASAGNYFIKEADAQMPHKEPGKTEKPSYFPLLLIFVYIAGVTLLLQLTQDDFNTMHWMASFMAGFFLVFSFFKLMNLRGFAEGYGTYDIVARRIPAYGLVYPFIELLLGIALLLQVMPIVTNVVVFVVMAISCIGVIQSLLQKRTIQCACLGTVIKLPLGKVTLFEDLLMVVMSASMLCYLLL